MLGVVGVHRDVSGGGGALGGGGVTGQGSHFSRLTKFSDFSSIFLMFCFF